ncbi:hypothetical protein CC2G_008032 [Coprinopsis cinerea AmutBmut pab1-1]|nr:hypothetical protein CC2G_008032 [Coprinopsis cinerea AmutBmut pab1-1]
MLSPPLSTISNELLHQIVGQVAGEPFCISVDDLHNLSLADRAFTTICQMFLYEELKLKGTSFQMARKLDRQTAALQANPDAVNFVRRIVIIFTGISGPIRQNRIAAI